MTLADAALDALAEGLWLRLRDVVLAAARLDAFNFAPEVPTPAPAPGWVRRIADDGAALDASVLDLVRRAVAAGADPVNWRILERLDGRDEGMALVELAAAAGLPPLALAERVSDLVQVGLAAHVLERGAVQVTAAGRAWLRLVEALGARVGRKARAGLPGLVAG